MHQFPEIRTIDDVLPAIEGRSEFIIADRGDHVIINYVVDFSDTFVDDEGFGTPIHWMRRECRGIIFDKNGYLIRRPFHKFANIGQWKENQVENLDFSKVKRFMSKEDGSFIAPYFVGGRCIWGTKMGDTDIAAKAKAFVDKNPQYQEFADLVVGLDKTPIFEYVAPDNRIVIEYKSENLILLGLRDMLTGEYLDIYNEPVITYFGIPIVSTLELNKDSSFIDEVRKFQDSEGVIVEFEDGSRHKCKADKYCELHRIFDELGKPRHIIAALVHNTLDDILPSLDVSKRAFVDSVVGEFQADVANVIRRFDELTEKVKVYPDKKTLALEFVSNLTLDKSYAFKLYDGKLPKSIVMEEVQKNVGRDVHWVELVKWMKEV